LDTLFLATTVFEAVEMSKQRAGEAK
jgi:hypothetical protein